MPTSNRIISARARPLATQTKAVGAFAILSIATEYVKNITRRRLATLGRMMNGFSTGEEDSREPTDQICCLVDAGERCLKPAGNASYSKRIQKTVIHRKLQLNSDNSARHKYICDFHKMIIQSARTKRRRKDSEEDSNETDPDVPDVDLYQLQVNTLRRYKRHYKVSTRPGLNKLQLADQLMKHFKTIPIKEKDILTFFIYTVKTNSNKLDQKNGMSDNT